MFAGPDLGGRYAKAIRSLKKYPLPLTSGQEATQLEHIGAATAKKLDEKLAEFCKANNLPAPPPRPEPPGGAKKKRKVAARAYIPQYRSGPYAILVTLLRQSREPGYLGYLNKRALQ